MDRNKGGTIMEAERQKEEKKTRPVSEKNTPFNIAERKAAEAAKIREDNPFVQALYDCFMPGMRSYRSPKFVTDQYGNRIRNIVETKKG